MIIGVGTDLIEIERVREAYARSGKKFLERVLTPMERALAYGRGDLRMFEFIAGRFAAKEAVVKALGCGLGRKVGFQDIEVLPSEDGKPICTISKAALGRLGYDSLIHIHISITHSRTLASAYAIAEQPNS